MCLVSVCPKGTEKNSEYVRSFITQGMRSNSQGSGYMFKRHGEKTITVNKGFFNTNDLIVAIENADLKIDDELVIHHRISTSGLVSKPNCHPFVLSNKHAECSSTLITTEKPCLAHNGMFSELDKLMALDKDFSDTYAFARYVMSNPNLQKILDTDENLFTLLTKPIIRFSKIAILHPTKSVILIGDFVDDKKGYYHSNSGYCDYVYNRGGFEIPKHTAGHSSKNGLSNVLPNTYDKLLNDIKDKAAKQRADNIIKERLALSAVHPSTSIPKQYKAVSLKLDSSIIKITETNFSHFYFVSKSDYERGLESRVMQLFIMPNYDSKAVINSIKRFNNGMNFEIGLTTESLNRDYYFIPKTEVQEIYLGFNDLVNSIIYVGNQTLKKIDNLLARNANVDEKKSIYYKRLSQFYPKGSLMLYRDLVEEEIKHRGNLIEEEEETEDAEIISINTKEEALSAGVNQIADALDAGESVEVINAKKDLQDIVDFMKQNN